MNHDKLIRDNKDSVKRLVVIELLIVSGLFLFLIQICSAINLILVLDKHSTRLEQLVKQNNTKLFKW